MHSVAATAYPPNSTTPPARARPSARCWAGRILSALVVLLLAFDSVGKLLELTPVIEGTAQLGYPPHVVFGLGVMLLACVVVYSIPATSVLGAILLTGYLGGAVATHVRVEDPLLTHVLAPVYLGALLWAGLVLRDDRLRSALSGHRSAKSGAARGAA